MRTPRLLIMYNIFTESDKPLLVHKNEYVLLIRFGESIFFVLP